MSFLRKCLVSIVVLLALALGVFAIITGTQYRRTVLREREFVLRQDLARLRESLKDYALKQELPPQALDDLVKAGYLREIPFDPITEKRDWQVTEGEVERASKKLKGIVDVHSASTRTASDGTPYNHW